MNNKGGAMMWIVILIILALAVFAFFYFNGDDSGNGMIKPPQENIFGEPNPSGSVDGYSDLENSDDDFASAAATGILILFFVQFLTNVGANVGLLPITGVTLPFVSYGGSSLIMNLLLIGIIQGMMVRRY